VNLSKRRFSAGVSDRAGKFSHRATGEDARLLLVFASATPEGCYPVAMPLNGCFKCRRGAFVNGHVGLLFKGHIGAFYNASRPAFTPSQNHSFIVRGQKHTNALDGPGTGRNWQQAANLPPSDRIFCPLDVIKNGRAPLRIFSVAN
jgi:hypothetical protein